LSDLLDASSLKYFAIPSPICYYTLYFPYLDSSYTPTRTLMTPNHSSPISNSSSSSPPSKLTHSTSHSTPTSLMRSSSSSSVLRYPSQTHSVHSTLDHALDAHCSCSHFLSTLSTPDTNHASLHCSISTHHSHQFTATTIATNGYDVEE
jgi:hypothetical protein